MKSALLKKFSVAAVMLLMTLVFANTAKAQVTCPYVIQNNLTCQIDIQYTIFGPGCPGYTNTVTIPPGGQYVIQCWDSATASERISS